MVMFNLNSWKIEQTHQQRLVILAPKEMSREQFPRPAWCQEPRAPVKHPRCRGDAERVQETAGCAPRALLSGWLMSGAVFRAELLLCASGSQQDPINLLVWSPGSN